VARWFRCVRSLRKFRPLTDEVVRGHLVGDHTIGIYPLLQDETCWFLAVDFDKKTWQKDATAFLAVCCELNVPGALERSRSGNGGHVWIFFDRPISATTARKLGCAILTRAMESRHQLGLDSYDRFFPQPRHHAKGRAWQLNRSASAKTSSRRRKQRLHGCGVSSVPRPMGFSGEHETDAHFCCRGRRSGSPTKWRPCRSENQLCGR
jgi:hypothetical protein